MSRCRRVASFFTTLLTVFQTSSHFLNSSHHCLITQQPFPHSSMANHCSIATCLILLSCHYGLLIAGQSTKKICHEKTVAAALNGSATKMRKRKKKKFITAIYYMILNAPLVHSSESILLQQHDRILCVALCWTLVIVIFEVVVVVVEIVTQKEWWWRGPTISSEGSLLEYLLYLKSVRERELVLQGSSRSPEASVMIHVPRCRGERGCL